ncbi:related to ribosomal protein YmL36 precursor, mitochondrial [Fusarium torulosum]|uniref:Related to ribosomal protein YmL36, mitochondrial n=1 Tax=Fusarium torulosum TaxID=33205 RepID=A0AAE8LY41_9HYPO|nr:related to ribosomal protein YmL36 precursor, mitochondrial [Fusarium torulosum]
MAKLSISPATLSPIRTTLSSTPSHSPTRLSLGQVRHATFIPRPRRPYTFTQLVTLSDGSSYTMRTTSPLPIYRAAKDTRNTLLWQPSERSLKNVELDEAGRLAAFRERFGRAYDSATAKEGKEGKEGEEAAEETDGGYADLITGYAPSQDANAMRDSGPKKQAKKRK